MTDTPTSMDMSHERREAAEVHKPRAKECPWRGCSWILALKISGVLVLALLVFTNFLVTALLWGTNFVEDKITQGMVIENNTRNFDWWAKSPIQPYMQVRMFNYTNVDRFLSGADEKLEVREVGPYVYKEIMERVNVQFHDNGTVSYQEKRSFEFCPHRSSGALDDMVTVPNMVLLGAAPFIKKVPYGAHWFVPGAMRPFSPFITKSASELFWGYEDPLFLAAKTILTFQGKKAEIKKIGLLISRNGTSSTRITIHTGAQNISMLGLIDRFSGMDKFAHWSSDECNSIDGTDGSMFPPDLVHENATLHMFMKDMCRKFPFVFKEYVTAAGSGVRAMRFHPPRNVFDNALPENACFCHSAPKTQCLPSGVFNASPCAFGAPLVFSFPHFYLGDPALLLPFSGLEPDPAKHDMFLDIHPKFGFPVAGESRFQLNMMVLKSYGLKQLEPFEDEAILPIAWFEVVIDEVPPEVKEVLQELLFFTYTIKWISFWTFFVLLLCCSLLLGFCLVGRCQAWPFKNSTFLSTLTKCHAIPSVETKACQNQSS